MGKVSHRAEAGGMRALQDDFAGGVIREAKLEPGLGLTGHGPDLLGLGVPSQSRERGHRPDRSRRGGREGHRSGIPPHQSGSEEEERGGSSEWDEARAHD